MVNVSEALKYMIDTGKLVRLSNSDTIFRLYRDDVVVMMVETTPITAHVCSNQSSETFLEQFKTKTFEIYEK